MKIAHFLTGFIIMITSVFSNADVTPISIGSEAPGIEVTTDSNETLSLEKVFSEGPVLIYFYPKADTPGCTKQACNLRDHFTSLQEKGIRVFGVSGDNAEAQSAFKKKYSLPFTLIADTDGKLGKALGVKQRMGSFYSRQSFLIVDGKIVWRDLKATPASQAQDALTAYEAAKSK